MKFEWETIAPPVKNNGCIVEKVTNRAKVIGGWIVQDAIICGRQVDTAIVFIPDPNHEWVVEY